MSQCAYCTQRKGKRPCPAMAGLICSQCCGEHRIVRIPCPADCVYLESGSEYQQKRLAEQLMPVRRDFYRELAELGGEKAVALFNLVEVVIFGYFHPVQKLAQRAQPPRCRNPKIHGLIQACKGL